MKALKVLNTIALAIPLTFLLLSSIDANFLFYVAFSTMATGFIQVMTGVFFWHEFPKNVFIKIYFFLVVVFFTFLYFGLLNDFIWFLPPALCLYLSALIYTLK